MKDFQFFRNYNAYYKKLLCKQVFLSGSGLETLKPRELDAVKAFLTAVGDSARFMELYGSRYTGLSKPAAIYVDHLRAVLELASGNLENAEALIEKGMASGLFKAQYHYLKGLLLFAREEYTLGASHLEKSIKSGGKGNGSYAALAFLNACAQDWEKAFQYAKTALANGQEYAGRMLKIIQSMSSFFLGKREWAGYDLSQAFEPIEEEIIAAIPGITFDQKYKESEKPILMVSCDSVYLKEYGVPLFLSVVDNKIDTAVHFHIVNPDESDASLLATLVKKFPDVELYYSFETANLKRFHRATYLSCIRFVRLYQLMQLTSRPFWLMDADGLLRKDPDFAEDYSLRLSYRDPQIGPPWSRIVATTSAYKNDEISNAYLAQVASIIIKNLYSGEDRWFLDQVALSSSYHLLMEKDRIDVLSQDMWAPPRFSAEANAWHVTNDAKFENNLYNYYKDHLLNKYGFAHRQNDFNELVKTEYGFMLVNRNDKYIGASIKNSGYWCKHELNLLRRLIQPGDWIVEAGANIGAHAVHFSKYIGNGGRLFCFEPQRLVYQTLVANIALNNCTNVHCFQQGLGKEEKEIELLSLLPHLKSNFGAVSLLQETVAKEPGYEFMKPYYERVAIRSLDSLALEKCQLIKAATRSLDLLAMEKCHLIKADVEGMELDVLNGASATIQKFRPFLYLEHHSGADSEVVLSLLKSWDYAVFFHGTRQDPNILAVPLENLARYQDVISSDQALGERLM